MLADVWDFSAFRILFRFTFQRNHSCPQYLRSCDDKGVGALAALVKLSASDVVLEVFKDFPDELRLGSCGHRKQGAILIRPFSRLSHSAILQLAPDFAGRGNLIIDNQLIKLLPKTGEDVRIVTAKKLRKGIGVKYVNQGLLRNR